MAVATSPASAVAETRATLRASAVSGLGTSLPEQVVANSEIEARLGLADGWIERRTGIQTRRVAAPGETLLGHSVKAGRRALSAAGVDPAAVSLVLVATTTADQMLPNAAPLVAEGVGALGAGAFDLGAACTGFLSALAMASGWIESGRGDHVLIVGADFMTRITDPQDRGTAAVFADGAGAAVISVAAEGEGRIGPVLLGSDGSLGHHIQLDHGSTLVMDGHETFRYAVQHLAGSTVDAVAAAGLTLDEIDLFVYHQANRRILTAVADTLQVDAGRVVDCIAELGNTSAATLPLALAYCQERQRLMPGENVLLGAFGAGLTWGAGVLQWGI